MPIKQKIQNRSIKQAEKTARQNIKTSQKTIKKAEAKNNDNNMKKMLIIGGTIVAGVIILIILIIIARKRRLEKIEEEDEEFSQYNNININDIYKESIQNTFDEEDGDYERKRKNSKGKRYK